MDSKNRVCSLCSAYSVFGPQRLPLRRSTLASDRGSSTGADAIRYVLKHLDTPFPWPADRPWTAGLTRNLPIAWSTVGPYNGDNDTLTNQLWEEINYDAGAVALTDDYAKRMGLPTTQRFPWDKGKGIYILNGYHNLHCLVQTHLPRRLRVLYPLFLTH
jgi:hypothetical protein